MQTTTKFEHSLEHGLNIETFEEFCKFAKANPADVQFELEATGASEGRAAHTSARTGPYTLGGQRIDRAAREYVFHMGAHREVEEALGFTAPTDRPEATEIVLAALTGCLNTVVGTSALQRGLILHHHEVRVRIAWDPAVFLHNESPELDGELRNQFGELQLELVVEGEDLGPEDLVYLEESMKRSAVYNMILRPRACTPTVTVQSLVASESQPSIPVDA